MQWATRRSKVPGRKLISGAVLGTLLALAADGWLGAQHPEVTLRWLPKADSLPAAMFTLVVVEAGTGFPVAHPMVCLPGRGGVGFMVGMADGRLRFGTFEASDTLQLRVLGPEHEARLVRLPWADAEGHAAEIALPRRAGTPIEPECE